ncbi:hypothetical protein K2173_016934 [Erythroxylum novogranatense]|uniref:DUF4283 domain-containing protein n=1 Tax=Erythroxylum novogranatense TaxID=1862640 RepID=A0AAV8U833_9ROSI|nr:hypothetical protein K2173_016934 [Erythroxylum novogranatense]
MANTTGDALAGLSLSDGEDDDWEVQPPEGVSTWEYDLCLVGMLLTTSRVNFPSLRDLFADLWRPQTGIVISDLGARRYLFRFFHKVDLENVLKRCPYDFQQHLLVLHRLTEGEMPLEVPLFYTDMWVQVHALQTGLMSEGLAKQFGHFIGKFLEYDITQIGHGSRTYMRIRVRIDVRIPLKRRKKLKI